MSEEKTSSTPRSPRWNWFFMVVAEALKSLFVRPDLEHPVGAPERRELAGHTVLELEKRAVGVGLHPIRRARRRRWHEARVHLRLPIVCSVRHGQASSGPNCSTPFARH